MKLETCMKGISVHIKNIKIKQQCGHKVWVVFPGAKSFRDPRETGARYGVHRVLK